MAVRSVMAVRGGATRQPGYQTAVGPAVRVGLGVVAVAAVAVLGLVLASPTVVIAGPIVVAGLVVERRQRLARAADQVALASLPVSVDRLIGQLRAGRSLSQACLALGHPGPGQAGSALQPLVAGLESGWPLAEVARRLATGPDRSVRLLAVALVVLDQHGGPAVPALQRLRLTLIGVIHDRQRAAAEAAQARASALMLVTAPTLFAVVIGLLDPGVAHLYLHEAVGTVCVTISIGLSLVGWLWMQRLVDASAGAASGGDADAAAYSGVGSHVGSQGRRS